MLLEGKVIVVTGGANGIGRIYCDALWQEGANIAIADIDDNAAGTLERMLNQKSDANRVAAFHVDVTSERDADRMANDVSERFGKIDVLINNAGVYPHVPFESISLREWRTVHAVNLDSAFLCAHAVLPVLKKQRRGKIINIATNLVWIGLPGMVHYVTAKAGLVGFTRSLAREVGEHGVTVNAIAPGAVIPETVSDDLSLERIRAIVEHQCIKRPLRASDLVGPMVFLCSDDSDFISGQVLSVDGGLTTH